MLDRELEIYRASLPGLLASNLRGKYVAVVCQGNSSFINTYDSEESAYSDAVSRFGNVPMLIRQIEPEKDQPKPSNPDLEQVLSDIEEDTKLLGSLTYPECSFSKVKLAVQGTPCLWVVQADCYGLLNVELDPTDPTIATDYVPQPIGTLEIQGSEGDTLLQAAQSLHHVVTMKLRHAVAFYRSAVAQYELHLKVRELGPSGIALDPLVQLAKELDVTPSLEELAQGFELRPQNP